MEQADLFRGSLGEDSDVVSKEMFILRSGEGRSSSEVALRPEGTAGVMRAYLNPQFPRDRGSNHNPARFAYAYLTDTRFLLTFRGPMFRYERPQAGRSRQFHQVGVEVIGSRLPSSDVLTISLARRLLTEWGLMDRCTLLVNTLGDEESRQSYQEALVTYFSKYKDDLSEPSQNRCLSYLPCPSIS